MKRLRILWLSHFVPYPPKGGCFQRSYNLITRVGGRHDLHLIAFRHKSGTHPTDEADRAVDELRRHCKTVQIVDISDLTRMPGLVRRGVASLLTASPLTVRIFRSDAVRRIVRSTAQSVAFDVVHFDTISLAQYLDEIGAVPTLMTHHGAESFMIRRRIRREPNWLRKLFFVAEWMTLERYERRMCPRFGVNIVMSDVDRRTLARIAPSARFAVVENGVDTEHFRVAGGSRGRRLIFAGRLDQYANRDAILHFMKEVWPGLTAMYPDAGINIIGHNPPEELHRLAARDRRVSVLGFVPDVRPYFQESTVAICPIRDGGGTRIKILDSLALGMPIVSTTIGCEGIDVVPDRDLLLADTPADFVRQIGRVFDDDTLRQRLRQNARRLAEQVYSWDLLAEKLMSEYLALAASRTTVDEAQPARRAWRATS